MDLVCVVRTGPPTLAREGNSLLHLVLHQTTDNPRKRGTYYCVRTATNRRLHQPSRTRETQLFILSPSLRLPANPRARGKLNVPRKSRIDLIHQPSRARETLADWVLHLYIRPPTLANEGNSLFHLDLHQTTDNPHEQGGLNSNL